MEVADGGDEGEAEAGAGGVAGGFGAEEAFDGAFAVGFGDAGTLIGDADFDGVVVQHGDEDDLCAGGGEFQGIVEQVGDGLLDKLAVAQEGERAGDVGVQVDAAFFGDGVVEFIEVEQDGGEVEGFEGGAAGAGFDFGDAEQGLEDGDDAVEVVRRAFDGAAQVLLGAGVEGGVLQPGAGAGDGGAQVVGDGVGDFAHTVHQAGNAVQHFVDDVGELVEFIAVAGFGDAAREVAFGDGAGGGGDVEDHPAEQGADDEGANEAEHRHDAKGPEQTRLEQVTELGAGADVSADEELIAALQRVGAEQGDGGGALAVDGQFVPGVG